MATRTVHLIDASPYVFRAWFALPDSIVDADGAPANAVRGFASFLVRYIEDEAPTHLGVAFDESLTTSFRNDLWPDYKAQRGLPPDELVAQLESCQEVAGALGAATFSDLRYEADDLIATLWRRVRRKGHHVVVATSDKDLAQLVDDGTELFDVAKGERADERGVRAKLGVRPDQVPDLLGLAGDAVDNIPGVPRVGRKTAVQLLERFDHLEDVYADLERVAELDVRGARSLAARLGEHRDIAFLSRELATVAYDAPATAGLRELKRRAPDPTRVRRVFERLLFRTMTDRVLAWT